MLYKRHSFTHWLLPDLVNGFAQPDSLVDQFAYRLTGGGIPDFKGTIDATGATSGDVAFTMILDPDEMTLPGDIYFNTIITDGTDFMTAMVYMDSQTGDVTLTWPAI